MKKDNFDLRSYLIENKMTENSRGDVRHQLGKTILDTRILSEMQIPADPTDHHDPEYDEDWASKQDTPDDIFAEDQNTVCPIEQFLDNWVDIVAYGADAEDYPEEGETFTATVAGHKIVEKYTTAAEQRGYGEITIDGKPLESFDENDPMFTELADALWSGDATYADAAKAANVQRQRGVDEGGDLGGDIPLDEADGTAIFTSRADLVNQIINIVNPGGRKPEVYDNSQNGKKALAIKFYGKSLRQFNSDPDDDDLAAGMKRFAGIGYSGEDTGKAEELTGQIKDLIGNNNVNVRVYSGETYLGTGDVLCVSLRWDPKVVTLWPARSSKPISEAGYTDNEDDDYASDDLDLDDRGGASLLDLVKGDRKAGRARKAAAVDTAADPAMDDEPVDTDAPEIDDPDAENAAGTSDPNVEAQPGLSAQVKYNPNTVEMMMDDQELDQYLSGFRRPQVAVNILNTAIRTAQKEVNDSIGLNHLYIVLENGFYVTSRTERGQVIAKVSADQEWRKKNFGED